MSFRDHIERCNNYAPARVVPLFAGAERIGLVRRDNAEALRRFPEVFAVFEDQVALTAQGDAAALSRAVDRVVDALVTEKQIPKDAQRDLRCRAALGDAAAVSPRPRRRPVFRHPCLWGASERLSPGRKPADAVGRPPRRR